MSEYLAMKREHLQALQSIRQADAKAEREHPSVIPSETAHSAH
jgi:hypothetical protein